VGGKHYGLKEYQHWDMVWDNDLDYFQGQITKYVMRWKEKNGLDDLRKAQHFLEKYIELNEQKAGRFVKTEIPVPPEGVTQPAEYTLVQNPAVIEDQLAKSAAEFLQYVKPTGWINFSFEGADSNGFLYTCGLCKTEVRCAQFEPPWNKHDANDCIREQKARAAR
jgi:hypothetical protein